MENGLWESKMEAEGQLGSAAVQVRDDGGLDRVGWMEMESTELADGIMWR